MVCHLISGPICDVLLADQRNVDILSQDFFNTFAMSSRLFIKMWTVCRMILGPFCDVLPPTQRNVDILSQDFFLHVCVREYVYVCVSESTNPWISVLCALT
jgi:hypothetical protein